MNGLSASAAAGLAVFRRDLQIFLSYRVRLVATFLTSFFSLTLFYYISRLVRVESFASPDVYYAFAVVGLVILQVLNSTLIAPPVIVRQELVAGTFERIVVSPFGPVSGLLAMLIFPALFALATGIVMLAFAGIVFGLSVHWATAALAVPVGLLGALAFAPFGILLLAVVLVAKQAAIGTTWVVAGISLIAGLYFPITLLPNWIEWAAHVQPFTPAVELLRNVLVDTPLSDPLWLDMLKLVGSALLLMPPAVWALGRTIGFCRRRGTIIEY